MLRNFTRDFCEISLPEDSEISSFLSIDIKSVGRVDYYIVIVTRTFSEKVGDVIQ